MSDAAKKELGREVRSWRLHRHSDVTPTALAQQINSVVRGWISYYGRYFRSALYPILARINGYLLRWAERKYKRLRGHWRRARRFLAGVATREPGLFVHWQVGVRPMAG